MRLHRASVLFGIGLLAATALAAQGKEKRAERRIEIQTLSAHGTGDHAIAMAPQAATYEFIAAGPGMEGKVVKGAPYSAEGVTETTRVLADGNKITHQSSSKVYRDSEGRSRREHTLGMIGALSSGDEAPSTAMIHDVVAGEVYILNHNKKEARKISVSVHVEGDKMEEVHLVHGEARPAWVERRKLRGARHTVSEHDFTMVHRSADDGDRNEESLGERNIEGVIANGTRTTRTIPAGQIGNEREITVVSERWYSPELHTVVLRETKDPMAGNTTYRLTNIQRGDPPAMIFEIPPDYAVNESGELHRRLKYKRKPKDK